MNSLKVEIHGIKRKEQAEGFIEDFTRNGLSMDGSMGMGKQEPYEKWLKYVNAHKRKETLHDMHVITSVYFAVREADDKIVGVFNIRHYLNDALILSGNGNIGYCVRPSERGKGYATEMLSIALKQCEALGMDKAHVSCYEFNAPSRKVIIKNKGILYNEYKRDQGIFLEYIIYLKQKD